MECDVQKVVAAWPDCEQIQIADPEAKRMAFPRMLIERLPNLKLITIVGMHLPNLDMDAATEHGVLVAHSNFANPRFRAARDATPELACRLMIVTVRIWPPSISACVTAGGSPARGSRWPAKHSACWDSAGWADEWPSTHRSSG